MGVGVGLHPLHLGLQALGLSVHLVLEPLALGVDLRLEPLDLIVDLRLEPAALDMHLPDHGGDPQREPNEYRDFTYYNGAYV